MELKDTNYMVLENGFEFHIISRESFLPIQISKYVNALTWKKILSSIVMSRKEFELHVIFRL